MGPRSLPAPQGRIHPFPLQSLRLKPCTLSPWLLPSCTEDFGNGLTGFSPPSCHHHPTSVAFAVHLAHTLAFLRLDLISKDLALHSISVPPSQGQNLPDTKNSDIAPPYQTLPTFWPMHPVSSALPQPQSVHPSTLFLTSHHSLPIQLDEHAPSLHSRSAPQNHHCLSEPHTGGVQQPFSEPWSKAHGLGDWGLQINGHPPQLGPPGCQQFLCPGPMGPMLRSTELL